MNFSKFVKALCLMFFLSGSISVMAQTSYLPSDQAMEMLLKQIEEIGERNVVQLSDMDSEVVVFSKSMYKMIANGIAVEEAANQTISAIESKYSNDESMMNGIKEEVMEAVTADS